MAVPKRPFQSLKGSGQVSLQRQKLQAQIRNFAPSAPVGVTPDTLALLLTSFAPSILTPRVVTPGKLSLTLTTFAPSVPTPRVVTPGKLSLTLTTFAPAILTPRTVTPGKLALTLTMFAPTVTTSTNVRVVPGTTQLSLTGLAPTIGNTTMPVISPYDWIFSPGFTTGAGGGGKVINVFRDTERFPGLPWKPKELELPNEPLPEQPPLAEPVFVELKPDNTTAFIALFESGALTEHEFVALLAA